jgi:hypothetical protein
MPMGGIVNNIDNPFIVYTVLYDYFKIKNNLFVGEKDLVFMVKDLYKGLNKKLGKKFSNSKFWNLIYTFRTCLDHSFGFGSYDSLRTIFAKNITNDLYMLPPQRLAQSEFDWIAGKGLESTIMDGLNKVFNLIPKLKKYSSGDLNEFQFSPTFQGVQNYLNNFLEVSKK